MFAGCSGESSELNVRSKSPQILVIFNLHCVYKIYNVYICIYIYIYTHTHYMLHMYIHPVNYFIHCHLTYDSFVFWNLPNSTSELQGLQVFKAPSFFSRSLCLETVDPPSNPTYNLCLKWPTVAGATTATNGACNAWCPCSSTLGIPVTAVINSEAAKDACERSSFSQKLPGFRR